MVSRMPLNLPMQLWSTYAFLMPPTTLKYHWWCWRTRWLPSSSWPFLGWSYEEHSCYLNLSTMSDESLMYLSSKYITWTDSTIIVLNWLDVSPRCFKTYVGNRIFTIIIDLVPPDKWTYVCSADNPADCASRGHYPSELLNHTLWWNGPDWLKVPPSN